MVACPITSDLAACLILSLNCVKKRRIVILAPEVIHKDWPRNFTRGMKGEIIIKK